MPVVLAIIFRVFWSSIYAKVKLIEPFMQLATPDGALARNSLHIYYLSSNLTSDAIISFIKGHWLVMLTSIVYSVVAILPSLASEGIFNDTNYGCSDPDPTRPENPCWPPQLTTDPVVARTAQGFLAIVAVITLIILIMIYRSPSGIYADPSSIAAVASLMHHPDVLDDFQNLNTDASRKDMKKQLRNKQYRLEGYQRQDGAWRYGIVPVTPNTPSIRSVRDLYPPATRSSYGLKERIQDTILNVLFAVLLLGVLGIVIAYFKDGSGSGFNRFFNSNSFGPKFLMTSLGSVISINWKRLDCGKQI